jgi:phage gp36-like protein
MANTIDFNVGTNATQVLNQTADAAENAAKGFTSAKAELRALNQQLLTMDSSSEEFKKASARAAELKDNISDLSAEINANAGNAFEGLSNNIGLFGSRLMDLDLKGAGQALTAMGGAVGRINFKTVKDELGGLAKGLKDLGTAVLTNPFFLTVGVLAAIAYNYKDIAKWASQTSIEQQNLAKVTDDLNKATEQELLKGAQKITQVEILTDRVKDNNLTEKERQQALKDLETMYPAYFSNLNGDINDTEALNAAKEKLITNIKAEAKANAAKSLLEAEYAKKIALEQELASKKGKLSLEEFNAAVEAAKFNQQTYFKDANQNLSDWWNGTEGVGKAAIDLEESIQRIAYLEAEATSAVLANVQTEVKAIHEKTKAATSAAQTEAEKKEAERQKELEANAVKAAKELKQEQDLAAQKLKVRQDYIRANQSAQANELYELELKKEQELQTWEGAEEDKVFIVEKYRLLELEIEKKYDDLALQQQIEAQDKAKAEKDKADEEAKKKQEDQLAAEQQAFNARLSIVSSGLDALVALNDAFTKKGQQQSRKQFQIQKALNLASAVVDTYGGINRALNDKTMPSTTARIIQASIVGAMGLANVLKISKTEYGNASTPSGTNMSSAGGGEGTTAPSPANFAFLQNQPNQQPPLQAYVVSTQVSSNLEAQQLINNQARLGG